MATSVNVTEYRQLAAKAMSEDDLTGQILDLAAGFGWTLTYHVPDSRRVNAGFPDWVLAHPGHERVIYAELKTEIGRVSPEQRRWLDVLTASGHEVHVWRPRDLLRGDIRDVLRGARP
jgi:hypothetical protein